MEHAKAEWNKRSLTDEAWLHRGTQGPGCKIEDQKKWNTRYQSTGRNVPRQWDYPGQRSDLGLVGWGQDLWSKFKGEVEVSP